MFRGREVTHPERGTMILDRLAEELAELGVVEQRPMQEGRNMTMMMAPSKAVLAGTMRHGDRADGDGDDAGRGGRATGGGEGAERGGERRSGRERRRCGATAEPVAADGADAPAAESQA